jgi:hypothetical protein
MAQFTDSKPSDLLKLCCEKFDQKHREIEEDTHEYNYKTDECKYDYVQTKLGESANTELESLTHRIDPNNNDLNYSSLNFETIDLCLQLENSATESISISQSLDQKQEEQHQRLQQSFNKSFDDERVRKYMPTYFDSTISTSLPLTNQFSNYVFKKNQETDNQENVSSSVISLTSFSSGLIESSNEKIECINTNYVYSALADDISKNEYIEKINEQSNGLIEETLFLPDCNSLQNSHGSNKSHVKQ